MADHIREIEDIRQMLISSQLRISHLALSLHKEQERIEDLIRIIDSMMIKEI